MVCGKVVETWFENGQIKQRHAEILYFLLLVKSHLFIYILLFSMIFYLLLNYYLKKLSFSIKMKKK